MPQPAPNRNGNSKFGRSQQIKSLKQLISPDATAHVRTKETRLKMSQEFSQVVESFRTHKPSFAKKIKVSIIIYD
jgi:hypothetical protein